MAEKVLTKTQAGIEATRGTIVPATRKVYGTTMLKRVQAQVIREEDSGTFAKIIGESAVYLGSIDANGQHTAVASFEDLAWWCQLAINGGVAPVQIGASGAYTYTFTPSQTVDNLKTATFEQVSDDTTNDSKVMAYGICDKITISGVVGGSWDMSCDLFGKDLVAQAATAGITDRQVESIKTKLTKIYVGAAGAAVPATELVGTVYEFKVHVQNNMQRKYFIGGADTFQGMGRAHRTVEAEMVFELNASSATEYANWQALTGRTLRIEATGTDAGGGNAKTASILLPGVWASAEIGNRGTNRIYTMKYTGVYNLALATDVKISVTNSLPTLP